MRITETRGEIKYAKSIWLANLPRFKEEMPIARTHVHIKVSVRQSKVQVERKDSDIFESKIGDFSDRNLRRP